MTQTQLDITKLAAELTPAMRRLDASGQRVALALYRLLAEGEPVPAVRLAERAGARAEEVQALLDGLPGVYRDDQRRVIGFWGMALSGMPHRMRVEEREVRAWCAWDTLFIPELLGKRVSVESPCPTTGEPVRLSVDPTGVCEVSPQGAVLSFLRPDASFGSDTIASFCHFVHFFVSAEAARRWTESHAGTFVLSIEDGFELGRLTNHARFAAALEGPAGEPQRATR
jgi:alkylmercury lyase